MNPGNGIRIGRIFGIPIYVHYSWFIIFALITFSLRTQFAYMHKNWSPTQHWTLGIITSLLFFGSVLFHELSHSVVALRYKVPVVAITLFVFGGVSHIEREGSNPKQEFNIAVAGPASSFVLAGIFYLIYRYSASVEMVQAAAKWLAWINLALGLFNLAPGFPLDGGRLLRAIAWGITKNFDRATEIASRAGQVLAFVLILIGIWQALNGNWIGGLWLAFIGWFLLNAAQESYAQVAIRNSLTGVRASDVMSGDVPTVPRDMSLEDYVHEVLRTGRRAHIVLGNGIPVGLITLQSVRSIPRDEWPNTSIQAAMRTADQIHFASPTEPVLSILERMQKEDINQMPVVDGEHIVGMIGRDSILRVLQTRIQAAHLAHP